MAKRFSISWNYLIASAAFSTVNMSNIFSGLLNSDSFFLQIKFLCI